MKGRIVFYTPTYRPAGGVIKLFDYARHAIDLGLQVDIASPQPFDPTHPIFESSRYSYLIEQDAVRFHDGIAAGLDRDDLAFFSWPPHHEDILRQIGPVLRSERLIHIVQGVRHADPTWLSGYATRLLSRPLSRIMISDRVMAACDRFVNRSSTTEVILEAHDWPFFFKEREGGLRSPMRVGYTTWKSSVGIEVERLLADDSRFEFGSIRETSGWNELRDLYHWSDVFLGTPGPVEGFYLPGLEAMAAGALVIVPDADGNLAYCRFGENCLEANHDDPGSYVKELDRLAAFDSSAVMDLRRAGYDTLHAHSLDRERDGFAAFLERILAGGPGSSA